MKNAKLMALACASSLSLAYGLHATSTQEDFDLDPASRGWTATGAGELFTWSSNALQVTWDSSKTNSYYALPLTVPLTTNSDFSLSFDLLLEEVEAGNNPEKPNPFQLAVGFINLSQAVAPGFLRGTGFSSPNLVEFSFFPDPGEPWMWGPSITASMIDQTGINWSTGGFGPFGLETGKIYRVSLSYVAYTRSLSASVLANGEPIGDIGAAQLGTNFLGFQLDHVAICSYSDEGQDPAYAGSIFARGTIDNIQVTVPDPVLTSIQGAFVDGQWQVTFSSDANFVYTLERMQAFDTWLPASSPMQGNGGTLTLVETNAPVTSAFYRVMASPAN